MSSDLHPTLRRLDDLAAHVALDPAALAVIGLGTAGVETARFDEHSDIDFFLVVDSPEAKQRYVDEIGWLDGFGGTVDYQFANDPNGRKVLFADGLFLEYAVFTPQELATIPFAGPRLVWSRAGFVLPERPAASPSAHDTVEFHLNEALSNLYIGLHRELRGERLAAMRFIQVYALDRVLSLVRLAPGVARRFPDPFEASRRVELTRSDRQPDWEQQAPGYAHNVDAAAATLAWLERWYAPDPKIVGPIRALIAQATSSP